jgi:hypothetical protein
MPIEQDSLIAKLARQYAESSRLWYEHSVQVPDQRMGAALTAFRIRHLGEAYQIAQGTSQASEPRESPAVSVPLGLKLEADASEDQS